jgi:hypothetical protein
MVTTTRLIGFILIAIGIVGYVGTGMASLTALIPAMIGALFLVLALAARSPEARKHMMHVAVAISLLAILGTLPRLVPSLLAGNIARPAVISQTLMVLVLLVHLVLGVKSFIDARRARAAR